MKLLTSLLSFSFLLGLTTPALAASDLKIQLTIPEQIVFDEDTAVTIEVVDGAGKEVAGKKPDVEFAPTKAVEQLSVIDCGDEAVFDQCQVNNRGVKGLYEAQFVVVDAPVKMSVFVDEVTEEVTLQAVEKGDAKTVNEEEPAAVEPEVKAVAGTEEAKAPETALTADKVQVGPSPSVMFVLWPLVLMCIIVTYFVIKTTEE